MKRIFQKKAYKSNPQYESLRLRFANPKLKDSEGFRISIFKDLFHAIVLKTGKSLKIDWIRDLQFKTNLLKSGFEIHDTIQIQDSFCEARIEPFWSQDL